MKKRTRKIGRKRFLAGLLSLAMVLTLTPVQGVKKAEAAETEAPGPETDSHYKNGFCVNGKLEDGEYVHDADCKYEGCEGYQPADKTVGKYDYDNDASTDDVVYEIGNAGQLYWFAALVNSFDWKEENEWKQRANAILTNDITVNKNLLASLKYANDGNVTNGTDFISWDGLNNYNGTFDGNNKKVSGLFCSGDNVAYSGLCASLSNGNIRNVGVVDFYFKAKWAVGGVCAYNDSGSITNCYSIGTVTGDGDRDDELGGMCGYTGIGGSITNCYSAAIVMGDGYLGGVCGAVESASIKNCYFDSASFNGEAVGWKNPYGVAYIESAEGKTPEQFASGEVAYLLSEGCIVDEGEEVKTYDGSIWGQKLTGDNSDQYPKLYAGGSNKVYYNVTKYQTCDHDTNPVTYTDKTRILGEKYSNTPQNTPVFENRFTYSWDNAEEKYICSVCKQKFGHENVYSVDEANHKITARCLYGTEERGSLTISAPVYPEGKNTLIYDGSDKKATTSGLIEGVTPTITYEYKDTVTGEFKPLENGKIPIDAGIYKASVSLTGADNKTATVSVTYNIEKAAPQIKWTEAAKSQSLSYTGSEIAKDALTKPTVTLQGSDSFSDWDQVSYSYQKLVDGVLTGDVIKGKLPTDVGTYAATAMIPASADGNYTEAVSEAMTLTIMQAENQFTSALACADYTYEKGKTPAPSAEAQFGEVTYKYAKVTYGIIPTDDEAYLETPPTDVGTYTVKAYVQETANYKGCVSVPVIFTIAPSSVIPNMPDASKTLQPAYSTGTVGRIVLPPDWSWSEADRNKTLTDEEITATAVYTGSDSGKGNYVTESVELTIQRSACDHPNKAFQNEVKATCTTGGFSGDVYCADCGAFIEYGKATEALGHTYSTPQYVWGTDADGNVICTALKTCTREGCTDAETDHAITETVKATGAVTKKPTCTEKGTKTYTATFSKEGFVVQTKDENIAATGHTLTYVPAKEATATIAGNKAYFVCGDCGKYYEDSAGTKEITDKNSVIIPAKGTTPVTPSGPIPTPGGTSNPTPTPGGTSNPIPTPGGTSTPSTTPSASPSTNPTTVPTAAPSMTPVKPNGSKIKDSTGTTYKVTDAKSKIPTVQYAAPKSGAKGTVTIPTTVTIDKVTYKVTSIADSAFKGNKKIKKVVIGSNIVSIGKNAFNGCKKLKTLIIKTKKLTAKSVAKGAFKGIGKKAVVKVPKSKYKAYKKLLCAKGLSKKVKIKK